MDNNKQGVEIFTFKNSHDAIAAEQLLINAGFSPRVMPLPANIRAGCGICLRIDATEREKAVDVLAGGGIVLTKNNDVTFHS